MSDPTDKLIAIFRRVDYFMAEGYDKDAAFALALEEAGYDPVEFGFKRGAS